ncbi:MAG: glycosyltransferase [Verrucomicrobia bacterium]|nr:glycosyltransferase [Verrucomicrobiota bacterium]
MSNELPFVTIIIPTRPGDAEPTVVAAARGLDYPQDRLEILVARGQQPSVQRNIALRAARGDLIYFLDDDALPQAGNLRQAVKLFHDPAVAMVGGPNLCPAGAPLIERVFAVVLSSKLAFGPSCARYDSVGQVRATSEKELILCNLMARRAPVMDLGGFDEALYPNEENALMDELQKRGHQLLYDPQFIAHRRPRPTLKAFCKMLMTYGRGRAEQFRLHPTLGSALNLVPPLFCVYLVFLPLLCLLFPQGFRWTGSPPFGLEPSTAPGTDFLLSIESPPFVVWPLFLYALALLTQTAKSTASHGLLRSLLAAPLLAAAHVFYGLGFWRGLFTTLKAPGEKPKTNVVLEKL